VHKEDCTDWLSNLEDYFDC